MCDGCIQLRRITPSVCWALGFMDLVEMCLKDAAPILRGVKTDPQPRASHTAQFLKQAISLNSELADQVGCRSLSKRYRPARADQKRDS